MRIKKVKDLLKDSRTDPLGSYTGVVTEPQTGEAEYEVPVQDADDL